MRLIDADALIDTIQRFFNGDALEYTANSMSGKDVVELLRSEPMVNVVGGWHDAKQEMPKRENMYLVCFYNGDIFTGGISRWDGDSFFRPDGTRADVSDYWMEFPDPPEVRE